jgi:copper oxidase (laccase) domain-containing protein
VLEATVAAMQVPPQEILVWMGAAIGPQAFEVGDEVREAFVAQHPEAAAAFLPHPASIPGKWLADIYQLARIRFGRAGVPAVYGGGRCTFSEADSFYSYRRDGVTGRMASLIWLEPRLFIRARDAWSRVHSVHRLAPDRCTECTLRTVDRHGSANLAMTE